MLGCRCATIANEDTPATTVSGVSAVFFHSELCLSMVIGVSRPVFLTEEPGRSAPCASPISRTRKRWSGTSGSGTLRPARGAGDPAPCRATGA